MKKFAIIACALAVALVLTAFFAAPTGLRAKRGGAAVGPPPASGPADPRVDGLFAEWNRSDSPGCAVAISRNGSVLYERGYGMASLELRVPVTPESVFHVASISKQFTAMSILLLAGRGRLSLDDEVRKHIPEWADQHSHLTIRHLLTHTGGLRDGFLLRELAAPSDDGGDVTKTIVGLLAKQRSLNFAPGSDFQYSNSGYTVLAEIVRRASAQPLSAFADANIFRPLGMTHTHVHDDAGRIVPNRTSGYHQDADGLRRRAVHGDLGHLVGTTGLFTTTRDLLRWEENFTTMRVGEPALVAAMQQPTTLTGGARSPYGFGLEIGEDDGLRTVAHGGGDPGYAAYVVRYPDQALAVAVLCNLDNIGPRIGSLARSVAQVYLGRNRSADSNVQAAATAPRAAVSVEQLAGRTGLYRDPAHETFGRIIARDGRLFVAPDAGGDDVIELTALGADRFAVRGSTFVLEFPPTRRDGVPELRVTGAGPVPLLMRRVTESFAPSSAELSAFAGNYASQELQVTYTVTVRGSGLAIRIPGRADVDLRPIFPDAFFGRLVGAVEFSRNAGGSVAGFTINTPGVRGLRFDRMRASR